MAKNYDCTLDTFAKGIEELVGDIPVCCTEAANKAVRKSTRKGVNTVKKHAKKGGKHVWSDEYVGGFSSHITAGVTVEGEIGNKAKPGLVHLLEKGHATLNGRRTNAYPHMAPAFGEISKHFVETFEKEIGAALK